jgi:ABC-type antimicrobial peptide transport system permease subunit
MTKAAEGDKGLNVFCSPDSFEKWGVGERNLTELSIKINNDASIEDADNLWYDTIAQNKGISSYSTTEITESMNKGTRKIMSIYYSMMIIVLLTSAVTVAITLYTDIRMRSSKFAMLRACGMSARQILFMIWRQNIIYPIIGAGFSVLPVIACNKLFRYILEKVESGQWTSAAPQWAEQGQKSVPWIADVPYIYDLFNYHVVRTVIILFVIYLVLMLLVTLPQIRFIRKQSIVEEIEKPSF